MPGGIVKVSLFRHHVAHRARFQGGRLVLEDYSLLQKKIRFKRLVGALRSESFDVRLSACFSCSADTFEPSRSES
jgi:hypothetical protein